jgi:hypothetical protein
MFNKDLPFNELPLLKYLMHTYYTYGIFHAQKSPQLVQQPAAQLTKSKE